MKILFIAVLSLLGATFLQPVLAAEAVKATVHKSSMCACCSDYVVYLREQGFEVEVVNTEDLAAVKQRFDIPEALQGCHSTEIGGYVVEGHVPIEIVNRLLEERPSIRGVALPGMPEGAPGMAGEKTAAFVIYGLTDDATTVYAVQ